MRTKGVGGLRQMRQPYDIICAALFAIHHRRLYGTPSICLRSLSAFYFCLFFCRFRQGATSGFINGPSSSVSCSSASSTQSKYLHNVQLCVPQPPTYHRPPPPFKLYLHACVCNLWVAIGRQQHLACLMFTLQNAITETANATAVEGGQDHDKQNSIWSASKSRAQPRPLTGRP